MIDLMMTYEGGSEGTHYDETTKPPYQYSSVEDCWYECGTAPKPPRRLTRLEAVKLGLEPDPYVDRERTA